MINESEHIGNGNSYSIKDDLSLKQPEKEGFIARKYREVKRHFRSLINPEALIGPADMDLFRAAKYNDEEIRWIAKVKKSSLYHRDEIEAIDNKYGWTTDLSYSAYDLVRLMAMVARDNFKRGNNYISPQTEKLLDKMIGQIGKRATTDNNLEMFKKEGSTGSPLENFYLRKFTSEMTSQEKVSFFSKALTIMHQGGNREALDIFPGYPPLPLWKEFILYGDEHWHRWYDGEMGVQRDFLYRLNHLGERSQQER